MCRKIKKTQIKTHENESMEEKAEFEKCLTVIREKARLTVGDIQKAGNKINSFRNSVSKKKIMAEELRKRLFDYYYPFPNKCKKILWIVVFMWGLGASFLVIVYGINFDVITEYRNNTLESYLVSNSINQTCWETDLISVIQNSYERFYFFFCIHVYSHQTHTIFFVCVSVPRTHTHTLALLKFPYIFLTKASVLFVISK